MASVSVRTSSTKSSGTKQSSSAVLVKPHIYKTLAEVKVDQYKLSEIEENADGTKFVDKELCVRPADVVNTDSGDWQLNPNRWEKGLTKGSTRDNNRFGKPEEFKAGDKVVVPSPTLNQLCDGGIIRPEGPKKVAGEMCLRIEWIPTREGSNKNLLDYMPAWVRIDNILRYQSRGKDPDTPSEGRPSRDATKWTFENMLSLQLNREVVSDLSGKNLYVLVSKSKKDNIIWGRPISSTGVPDATRFDLEMLSISDLGPRTNSFEDARNGFEAYRAMEDKEIKKLITDQKERAKALAQKALVLLEAASKAKQNQIVAASARSSQQICAPELEEEAKDPAEQTETEPKEKVVEEEKEEEVPPTDSPEVAIEQQQYDNEAAGSLDDNDYLLDINGEGDQSGSLDDGLVDDEMASTGPTTILHEFGLTEDLLGNAGVCQLLECFCDLRRRNAKLESQMKTWGSCFQRCHDSLKESKEDREMAKKEFRDAARTLHNEVEEVRAVGAGFGSVMKTMVNILSKNSDSSDSLKLLVSQMAKELNVRVVQPSALPDAFGEDLWVQMENFVRSFGDGGAYRIVRTTDCPPTLLKLSPAKKLRVSPSKLSNPAAALTVSTSTAGAKSNQPSTTSQQDSDLTLLSSSTLTPEPSVSTPAAVRTAAKAVLQKKLTQPVFTSARPQAVVIKTSKPTTTASSGAKIRPSGPWPNINFAQDIYFEGPQWKAFLKKMISRLGGNKITLSQLGPCSYIYWAYPSWDPATATAADFQNRMKAAASKITAWQTDLVTRKFKRQSTASTSASTSPNPRAQSIVAHVRQASTATPPRVATPPQEASSSRGGAIVRGTGRGRGAPRVRGRGAARGGFTAPPTASKSRAKNPALTGEWVNPFEEMDIDSSRFYEDGWNDLYSEADVAHVVNVCVSRLATKSIFTWVVNALNHLLQVVVYKELVESIKCWLDLNLSLHALRKQLDESTKYTFEEELEICKCHPWVWAGIEQFFDGCGRNIESLKETGERVLFLVVDRMVKNSFVWVSRPPKGRSIVPKVQQTAVNGAIWKRQEQRKIELKVNQDQLMEAEGLQDFEDEDADLLQDDDDFDDRTHQLLSDGALSEDDDKKEGANNELLEDGATDDGEHNGEDDLDGQPQKKKQKQDDSALDDDF